MAKKKTTKRKVSKHKVTKKKSVKKKKTNKSKIVKKKSEKEFVCPDCNYEAQRLTKLYHCPLCILCERCLKEIRNCHCIEGE